MAQDPQQALPEKDPPSKFLPPRAPHARPHLKLLPSAPQLAAVARKEIDDYRQEQAARDGLPPPAPLKPVSPEDNARLQKMMAGLKAEVAGAIPEAGSMAATTKFYVVPDDGRNMTSFTTTTDDQGHAVNTIVITESTLKTLPDAQLRATLAHELTHHLLAMNPELRDNPRYQPQSDQYKEEVAKTNFGPTDKQVADYRADFEHKNGKQPTELETVDWIRTETDSRRAMFKEEMMCDIIGLRLSKDLTNTQLSRINFDGGNDLRYNLDHSQEIAYSGNAGEPDPHPSTAARLAEARLTASDMQTEAEVTAARKGGQAVTTPAAAAAKPAPAKPTAAPPR